MAIENIINTVTGKTLPFSEDNVDTDQIAPTEEALYVLSWEEAGDVFCIKTRRNPDGSLNTTSVLNDPRYEGARILFAGNNFGCGSSREHATQGTKARYGAVVAISVAPIYADNAFAIGLPVVQVAEQQMSRLMKIAQENPQTQFRVDLDRKVIAYHSTEVPIQIDEAKRKGFLEGTWDEREMLLKNREETDRVLAVLPYI